MHGEWRVVGDELVCAECGHRLHRLDRAGARRHWEGHASVPAVGNGFEMVWYVHHAGEDTKHVERGTFGGFLAGVMGSSLLRPDLPVPHVGVVQELVNRGERIEGMGAGYEWSRFEVTGEAYGAAAAELIAMGLATVGVDPVWVDSLFFRRAERVAIERGTDVHHEIRRMTIMHESAAIFSRFPDLDEAVGSALRRRRTQANNYDFDQPLDPADEAPED